MLEARRPRPEHRPGVLGARQVHGLAGLLLCALGTLGCSASSSGRTSAVPGPRIEAIGEPTLGLRYRQSGLLSVRLFTAAGQPSVGALVLFTPVGDSSGTTLAADRALTDSAGVASLKVTAGAQAAAFEVLASAEGAEDVSFAVTVSRSPYADLAAVLSYTGERAEKVTVLRALVFGDKSCARLPPVRTEPEPLAQGESLSGSSAIISFPSLPTASYAVVARAEDNGGQLIARGCVDVLEGQLDAGAVQVPVPLLATVPALADAYRLQSEFVLDFAKDPLAPSPIEPWVELGTCPFGLGQALLDAVSDALGPGPLANRIVEHRGPTDDAGCRPESYLGRRSLDAQAQDLLGAPGTPGALLPDVVADLMAAVGHATVESRLAVTAATSPGLYVGSHALTKVTLESAGRARVVSYDPLQLGFPLPAADGIAVNFEAQSVMLADHGLTLRLPVLWQLALVDLALAPRGLPQDLDLLTGAIVDAARSMPGKQVLAGCQAVEELLCRAGEVMGPCAMAAACESAKAGMAATLAAPLQPRAGVDIMLNGKAQGIDTDGDLVVDRLDHGAFQALVGISPRRIIPLAPTFTGAQIPLQ